MHNEKVPVDENAHIYGFSGYVYGWGSPDITTLSPNANPTPTYPDRCFIGEDHVFPVVINISVGSFKPNQTILFR